MYVIYRNTEVHDVTDDRVCALLIACEMLDESNWLDHGVSFGDVITVEFQPLRKLGFPQRIASFPLCSFEVFSCMAT